MAGEYIEFNNNTQPAVNDTNLNTLQQLIKQDIQGAVSGDTLPIGAILPFGSNTVPENWLLCDGSAVSRTQYQDLFNTIGITFGQGDGFTTFNLPDLRDRVPVGKDSNDTDFSSLGNTGGSKNLQEHNHNLRYVRGSTGTGTNWVIDAGNTSDTLVATGLNAIKNAGTGDAGNLQPYIVTNYIIKAFQSAGTVATVVDNLNSTSTTDALSANQGNVLKELLNGTTLYENSTGTTGDVTLSQSIANMKKIRISGFHVYSDVKYHFCQEFDVILDGKTSLLAKSQDGATNSYACTEVLTLNSTSITRGSQYLIPLNGNTRIDTTIYITKVVGYNY